MRVDFQRLEWTNYPDTDTPINADNLNRIEEGVAGLYADLSDTMDDVEDLKTAVPQNTSEINTLKSRVDGIIALPDGSTTADAELVDIRTGAGGETYPSAGDAVRGQIGNVKNALTSETNARIALANSVASAESDINTLDTHKVAQPLDENNQPTDGTSGQSLRTNGDGTTEWADAGLPTDAQTAQAVSDWLDNHPEATTTVEDHSLTYEKFVNGTLGFVTYDMFGAKLNGIDDDSEAIIACHNFANTNGLSVIQHRGTILLKTAKDIEIKTNVDLSGCRFLLNDEIEDKNFETAFYVVKSEVEENIPASSISASQLVKGKTYIPFLDSYPNSFIKITSDKILGKRAYSDGGVTKYAPWYMSEVITTGQGGYLIDGTLLYDYTDANSIEMRRYSSIDSPITIRCPQLVVNRTDSTSMPSLFKVERSNVTVTGLSIKNVSLGTSSNTDFVGRVIYVNSFNCLVEKAVGVNPTEKFEGTMPIRSGYCIQFENASTGFVKECCLTDNWGVINTQSVKNMTFKDSILNRIDNHWTMNNFDIDNITMVTSSEGIVLGHGDGVVNINNVTYIHDKNYYGQVRNVLIKTRADLGGTYEGKVNINNVVAEVSNMDIQLTIFQHFSNIATENEFYKTEDISRDVSISNFKYLSLDNATPSMIVCYRFFAEGNPSRVSLGNIRVNNVDFGNVPAVLFIQSNTPQLVEGKNIFTDMIDGDSIIPQTIQDDSDYEMTTVTSLLNASNKSNRQIIKFAYSYFDGTLKHDSNYIVETLNTSGGTAEVSNSQISWTGMKGGALIFNELDFTPYKYLEVKGTLTQSTVTGGSHSLYSALKQTASWNGTTIISGGNFEGQSGDFDLIIPLASVNRSGFLCLYSWQQEITIDSIKCYR